METKKVNGEQPEVHELILKNLAEDSAKTNHLVADVITSVNVLGSRIQGITEKLDKPGVITVPEPDTRKIEQIIEKGIQDIRLTISVSLSRPKPTRFQMFMESKNKTWLVITILGFFLLTYGFFLCIYHVAR